MYRRACEIYLLYKHSFHLQWAMFEEKHGEEHHKGKENMTNYSVLAVREQHEHLNIVVTQPPDWLWHQYLLFAHCYRMHKLVVEIHSILLQVHWPFIIKYIYFVCVLLQVISLRHSVF